MTQIFCAFLIELKVHATSPIFRKIIMTIYRIDVSLRDIEPLIWRRIELSSQTTLKLFHRILQISMGWENEHLHEFLAGTKRYGIPDPTYDDPGEVLAEGKISLSDIFPAVGVLLRSGHIFQA